MSIRLVLHQNGLLFLMMKWKHRIVKMKCQFVPMKSFWLNAEIFHFTVQLIAEKSSKSVRRESLQLYAQIHLHRIIKSNKIMFGSILTFTLFLMTLTSMSFRLDEILENLHRWTKARYCVYHCVSHLFQDFVCYKAD